MKYLFSFDKINELVKNSNDLKFYVRRILRDIYYVYKINVSDNIRYEDDVNIVTRREPLYKKLEVNWIPEIHNTQIEKILKKWQLKLLKYDIMMSYSSSHKQSFDFGEDIFDMIPSGNFFYSYNIYFKNIHTRRIKPLPIIYHFSPKKNRESILRDGLVPQKSNSSDKWKDFPELAYIPCIFAMNRKDLEYGWYHAPKGETDVWEIDTSKIPNIWWEDLNYTKREDMIMTFTAIPAKYLKLL